jgi:hypothetical protein
VRSWLLATAPVLIAYMSDVLGRHVANMKPRIKVLLWMNIVGLVCGVTLIIGFFIELLVFNRWRPMLALSGTVFTLAFVSWLFKRRCVSLE